jgi:hypothetical protein
MFGQQLAQLAVHRDEERLDAGLGVALADEHDPAQLAAPVVAGERQHPLHQQAQPGPVVRAPLEPLELLVVAGDGPGGDAAQQLGAVGVDGRDPRLPVRDDCERTATPTRQRAVPLTRNKIRYLLAEIHQPASVLHWSIWRRAHQAVACACHYRSWWIIRDAPGGVLAPVCADGHDPSCGCCPFPVVVAAEWVGHVHAARRLAGAGSAGRGGDHGDVRFPEDRAAAGGGDPGSAGPVVG